MPRIRKRCFVQMFGYEPVDAALQQHRTTREMARFHKTWNIRGKAGALSLSDDGFVAHWRIDTEGGNWTVATDYYCLRWDDIVVADVHMSDWRRVPLGIAALAEFVLTGTAVRYFFAAWRYGCFFCVPLFALIGLIWLAVSLPWSALSDSGLPHPWLWEPVAALGVFAVLWRFIARRVHLRLALDDWCCAWAIVHRSRRDLEERLDRFARELVRLAQSAEFDEIVVHGHSLGAPLALMVIDRALAIDDRLGHCCPIHFVTTGSSLLKLALHPAAGWLREATGRVARAPAINWVDFQSINDFISMYGADPVTAVGLPPAGKPIVKSISVPQMLEEATYRRFRFDFWRIHRQPRMGNERRYFYDYFMLMCGPLPMMDWVTTAASSVAAFSADGALMERERAMALEAGAGGTAP